MDYFGKINKKGDYMDNRLKALREDNDLTQEECAKIAFISKNSYIRYENGERTPPFDTICRFADYYKTSTDYIGYRTNERTPYSKKK